MNQFSIVFLFIFKILFACASPFQIQFFIGAKCTGESLILKENTNYLNGTFQSLEITTGGMWAVATSTQDYWWILAASPYCQEHARNYFFSVDKAHKLGIDDTEIQAIAIIPPSKSDDVFVTTNDSEELLNFAVGGSVTYFRFATTGPSNWTAFERKNFEGESQCLLAKNETNFYMSEIPAVGSLNKGCSGLHLSEIDPLV